MNLSDDEIYEKILNGELRADVQYKGKPLTYEDVSDVIHEIKVIPGGGGMYIGEKEYDGISPLNFTEEPYGNGNFQIHSLNVDENMQKRGYGKCMMYIYLTYAQIKGYVNIWVINQCIKVPDFYSRFTWEGKEIEER